MTQIKFGTDGWRAIIAKDYTTDNVARVAKATALWLLERSDDPKITLGYDCRFGGTLFAETIIKVMIGNNVKVVYDKNFVSTPMISMATMKTGADLGIIITASHNPPSYNGYKIKASYGGPASPATIAEVEDLIPVKTTVPDVDIALAEEEGNLEYMDFEQMYYDYVMKNMNMGLINKKLPAVAYDAMYGAGQRIVRRLMPDAHILHGDYNPSFMGQAPEPLHKNLLDLSKLIANSPGISVGFATDGDADRIGLYDGDGVFVDAHRILLLLVHILHKYRKMSGKVVITFSTSYKIKKLCAHYGIECQVTKVGFKYVCEIMNNEDVLVGGEESGGIAVKGHIPERDGVWDALVVLEYLAESGKTINNLLDEVYNIVGRFSYHRDDLHLTNELKLRIMENCKNGAYSSFGSYAVAGTEDLDGYKFFLGEDSSIMIRPSGTEPVLRLYSEAKSDEEVQKILKEVKATLLK